MAYKIIPPIKKVTKYAIKDLKSGKIMGHCVSFKQAQEWINRKINHIID